MHEAREPRAHSAPLTRCSCDALQLEFRILPSSEFDNPSDAAQAAFQGAEAFILLLDTTRV